MLLVLAFLFGFVYLICLFSPKGQFRGKIKQSS